MFSDALRSVAEVGQVHLPDSIGQERANDRCVICCRLGERLASLGAQHRLDAPTIARLRRLSSDEGATLQLHDGLGHEWAGGDDLLRKRGHSHTPPIAIEANEHLVFAMAEMVLLSQVVCNDLLEHSPTVQETGPRP